MQSSATSTSSVGSLLGFRYVWNFKIAKRLMTNGERAILHVSVPFCTAYNGCQFTWVLRMCDQNVLEMVEAFDDQPSSSVPQRVNITLYYKNGPTPDITLDSANISVCDSTGQKLLSNAPLSGCDYTLGAGCPWAADNGGAEWLSFSQFVHDNPGAQISISVDLMIDSSWFQPLKYLPSLDSPDTKLETLCEQVLKEIYTKKLPVPDLEFFHPQKDKFAYHRHIFKFGWQEIERRLEDTLKSEISPTKIKTVFAHIYFNHVIMAETVCFEDFVEILEASITTNFPELRREIERFIAREVMVESADVSFVKKMLLLAERFQLPVLKMVSAGALVDKLISANSVEMREEFLQLAEQITNTDDDDADDESSTDENVEHLVHNVVDQLQSLAKHIRRVSLSASCGSLNNNSSPSAVSPACVPASSGVFAAPLPVYASTSVPNAGQTPPAGRRSSLKTSRELLTFTGNAGSLDSDNSSITNSPLLGASNPRRRSVMFALQKFRFEDEEEIDEEESGVCTDDSSGDSTGAMAAPETSTFKIENIRISPESQFALHVGP